MAIPTDTAADLDRAQLQSLRGKTPAERVRLAIRLSDEVRSASRRAIARLHPQLTARQREHLFIELHYGRELADAVRQHDEAQGNA